MTRKALPILAGLLMAASGIVHAECPLTLPQDQLIECLTIEGAGEDYAEYRQNLREELAEMEAAALEAESNRDDLFVDAAK